MVKYYWDSGIFIAWLMAEKGRVEFIDGVVSELNKKSAIVVTSVISRTEVLEGELDDDQRKLLNGLWQRRDIVVVNLDPPVADLAGFIRNSYRSQKPKISVKTPDAQHLATAIIYKVDVFHTFDDGLLRFDGNVAGHTLAISTPTSAQSMLPFEGN